MNSRLHPISIYATLALANAAAKSYLLTQSDIITKRDGEPPEIIHEEDNKPGVYDGVCVCREDRRHEFRVAIKRVELKGVNELMVGVESLAGAKRNEIRKGKKAVRMATEKVRDKRAREDNLDEEDGDVEKPARKISKTKSGSKRG